MIRKTEQVLRALGIVLILALSAAVTLEFFGQMRSSQDRGRLALGLLATQLEEVAALEAAAERAVERLAEPASASQAESPTESQMMNTLSFWLATQLAAGKEPWAVAGALDRTALRLGSHRENISTSFARWRSALRDWADSAERLQVAGKSFQSGGEVLFAEGRSVYHQVMGYRRIGREQDAVPLAFWSMDALRDYISANPNHPEVPEALYMTGDLMLGLRGSLPGAVRTDRILHLCRDLFPETIWAARAESRWNEEIGGHEI